MVQHWSRDSPSLKCVCSTEGHNLVLGLSRLDQRVVGMVRSMDGDLDGLFQPR